MTLCEGLSQLTSSPPTSQVAVKQPGNTDKALDCLIGYSEGGYGENFS